MTPRPLSFLLRYLHEWIAIITDSTCDLPADELRDLHIRRVPLYVNFRGEVLKDWLEITPGDIVAGVSAGAAIPSTSQPSPQDFINAFQAAVTQGATEILCITISSKLSGTYQSATVAAEELEVPVHVFDTLAASLGIAMMLKRAAVMRDEGADAPRYFSAFWSSKILRAAGHGAPRRG